jgi:hypothetical protein
LPRCQSDRQPSTENALFLRKKEAFRSSNKCTIPIFIKSRFSVGVNCQLCEEKYLKEEMESIGNCKHSFCIGCLNAYTVYRINIMAEVTCPQEGCLAVLDPSGSVFSRLPQPSKDRHKRNVLWRETTMNPHLRLCPT